jgi:co-chaperonin GroES (HSP10)
MSLTIQNYMYVVDLHPSSILTRNEDMADCNLVALSCPRPNGDRIAVLPDDVSEVSEGGILVVRDREEKPHTGNVVGIGAECTIPVTTGDRVYHGRFAGIAIEIDVAGESDPVEVIFMRKDEVIAYEAAHDEDDELPF